jgi:hypothetical protein
MRIALAAGLLCLFLVGTAAAQQPAAAVAPPLVRARILSIRDIPLPKNDSRDMSIAISSDGRRVVVSVSAFDESTFSEFAGVPDPRPPTTPQHPSTYLYEVEADKVVELRPVLEGKTWRLLGQAAISPDGRFVAAACAPEAEDAVLNGTWAVSTVALVDTTGDESRLIDLQALGFHRFVPKDAPSLSRDANRLALPTRPGPGSGNDKSWSMVWARQGGMVGAVVLDEAYDGTHRPRLSEDGRFLVTQAFSKDPEWPSGSFLMDLGANLPGARPAWPDGRVKLAGRKCSLSADGRRVASVGDHPRAKPGPAGVTVLLYDDATRSTTPVADDPGDDLSRIYSEGCSLSGSGAYVAYDKAVMRMAEGQSSSRGVYVRELASGRTVQVDPTSAEGTMRLGAHALSLSGDGRRLVYVRSVVHVSPAELKNLWDSDTTTEVVLVDIDWGVASPSAPR